MLRRIILENFMSHGRTEIDLSEGLTVLTGPNNCGKSAVVAALQILASNGRSTHVLRHGETKCRITVETDDGHTICWERKKSTVKYTINGEDIHRVGTSIPDSLHEFLKLDRVKAEIGASTHEYDIHFGEQKSPVFLLGETGSRAASFFASSSDASRLVEMQHRHRSNLRDRRSTGKKLAKEIEDTKSRLQRFAPMDAVANRIATAKADAKELTKREQKATELQSLIERLTTTTTATDSWRKKHGVLAKLDKATTTPSAMQEHRQAERNLANHISKLETLTQQQRRHDRDSVSLKPLQPAPDQHDVNYARKLMTQLRTTRRQKEKAQRVLDCCNAATPPPVQEPVNQGRLLLARLKTAEAVHAHLQKTTASLASLQPTPKIEPTSPLSDAIVKLKQAAAQVASAGTQAAAVRTLEQPPVQTNLESIRRQIDALVVQRTLVEKLDESSSALSKLELPIEIADSTSLNETIAQLKKAQTSVSQAQATFEEQKQLAADCERQLRTFVDANPVCQTCGATIDPDRLMAGVPGSHVHGEPSTAAYSGDEGLQS